MKNVSLQSELQVRNIHTYGEKFSLDLSRSNIYAVKTRHYAKKRLKMYSELRMPENLKENFFPESKGNSKRMTKKPNNERVQARN